MPDIEAITHSDANIAESWGILIQDGRKKIAWVDHNGDGQITFAEDFDPDVLRSMMDHDLCARGLALLFLEVWRLQNQEDSGRI